MNQDPEKLALELFPLTPNVPVAALETRCLFDLEPAGKPGGSLVSTTLCLFENPNKSPDEGKIDLARMRLLSNEEREEEQQYGVSTELNLYTDPWTIKKGLTITDLIYLNHLFLNTSTIHHHILRYLPDCDRRIVQEGWALSVDVYDHDTDSTHQMLLRKWTNHLYYVLSGGWFVDFVCRRALKMEDEIGMFWDRFDSKLHFRVLSRSPVVATYVQMDTLLPDP